MANYLCDPDGVPFTSATFSLDEWLAEQVPDYRLLDYARARRSLCRVNPLLFAILYLPNVLKSEETGNAITFSDVQLEMYRDAFNAVTGNGTVRIGYIASRSSGKSSMVFKILPIYFAAFKHKHLAYAMADSQSQASQHQIGRASCRERV